MKIIPKKGYETFSPLGVRVTKAIDMNNTHVAKQTDLYCWEILDTNPCGILNIVKLVKGDLVCDCAAETVHKKSHLRWCRHKFFVLFSIEEIDSSIMPVIVAAPEILPFIQIIEN